MESAVENESCPSTSAKSIQNSKNNIGELSTKNKRKNFNPRFAVINHENSINATAVATAASLNHSEQKSFVAGAGGNLNDSDIKFREFAFKTMQELLNIYGLSVSQNDILEAFKQQTLGHHTGLPQHYHQSNIQQQRPNQQRIVMDYNNHNENEMELPTPPRTPVVMCSETLKISSKTSECSGFSDSYLEDRNSVSSFLMANENSNSSSDHNNNDDHNLNNNNNNSNNNNKIHSDNDDDDDDGDDDDDNDDDDDDDYVGGDRGEDHTSDQEFLNDDISYDSNGQIKLNSSALNIFSPMLQLASLSDSDRQITVAAAYTKTLKKCQSYLECNNEQCQLDNLREHYHCYDDNCYGRVLNKKEEIIRHLKWHKKRNESLNHGFLRFSSSDDCTVQFGSFCQHNRKQTHYHCIQPKCDKVYISTSDVQMHSNYHRKDSAIIQEGFQRFRATEECNTEYCMFIGQRTTHFHCRRSNCNYTFKNKADMEKHKTYHIKDEQLARDGFKKFLKSEPCPFESCRFSRVCNHIHCTRNNCQYVLHSSGQLLSHKRKHERVDSETAYRQFKLAQKANGIVFPVELAGYPKSGSSTPTDLSSKPSTSAAHSTVNLPTDLTSSSAIKKVQPSSNLKFPGPENLELSVYHNLNPNPNTDENNFEHMIEEYFTDNCTKQADGRDDQCEPLNLKSSSISNKPSTIAKNDNKINCFMTTHDIHLHCLVKECEAVLPKKLSDIAEHLKMHELTIREDESSLGNNNLMQITSIEGFFNRKRGRPPKNRVVEVYSSAQESPQAIFTSFKLEKNEQIDKPNRTCTATKEKKEIFNELDDKSDEEQGIMKKVQPHCTDEEPLIINPISAHSGMGACVKIEPTSEEKLRSQVVRAAGTYFPQNSEDTQDTESQNSLTSGSPDNTLSCVTNSCKRPFCKLKRKIHHHCDLCNQAFSDEMKLKIHFLKHQTTKLGQLGSTNHDTLTTSPSSFTTALVLQQSRNQPSTSSSTLNLISDSGIPTLSKPSFAVQEQIEKFRANSINFVDHISFTHSFSRLDGKPYSYVQLNPFYNQEQYPMIGVTLNEKLIHEEINKQINPGCKLQIASFISEIIQENLLRSFAAGKFDVPKYDYIEQQISKTTNKRKLSDCGAKATKNARKSTTSEDDVAWMNGTGARLAQQKVFKDEPIPNGYTKFRFNEDCNFTNCGYRNHQSHFHCCRVDCFYSFCDKTRFVQHTARHERLDKLMGDDFKQYRANMRCGFDDCAYNKNLGPNNKSSHFHCLKCDFICSDTNKVVAHRRQHSKLEYIRMAGFRKVANNEQCKSIEHESPTGECSYSLKQTHYHCLMCDGSVLSRAQLGSHRHRI